MASLMNESDEEAELMNELILNEDEVDGNFTLNGK
jgi:hypothetical protein